KPNLAGQPGKSLDVFLDRGRLAGALAQVKLMRDQAEQRLGASTSLRLAADELFDSDSFSPLPARALLVEQSIDGRLVRSRSRVELPHARVLNSRIDCDQTSAGSPSLNSLATRSKARASFLRTVSDVLPTASAISAQLHSRTPPARKRPFANQGRCGT